MHLNLDHKVAVVTGGSGIIGSEISFALSASGAKVAVLGHTEHKVKKTVRKIEQAGGKCLGLTVDVLNEDSVEKAAEMIVARWEKVDILVNAAGGNKPQATTSEKLSFFDLPREAVQWVYDLNLLGTWIPCQVFGRIMAGQKEGSIINISSMAAYTPLTRTAAYSAAKAGVSNFTQWLAVHFCQEYSPRIRVNAIAPGFLLTDQNRYLLIKEDGTATERGQNILLHTPMGRYGNPAELCGAVIFLCSDQASFITGVVLPVDGGFSAFSGV